MGFELANINHGGPGGESAGRAVLNPDWLAKQLQSSVEQAVRLERLMAYYRNDQRDGAALGSLVDASETSRPYAQAQEFGLPPRITGYRHDGFGAIFGGERIPAIRRKEIVIENDIGWRVDTMIAYLFGRPVGLRSLAADVALGQKIQTALNAAIQANGGQVFLRQLALFAHVYGFVDVIVRGEAPGSRAVTRPAGTAKNQDRLTADLQAAAGRIVFDLVEADRAVPVINADDYRRLDFYVQHFRQRLNEVDAAGCEQSVMVTEILAPHAWQRYHDGELVAEGENPIGKLPIVHVQNMPRPFFYEGESEVERLIPMQDELNARLSDRANRISFQSFKMYLGRGIANFEDRPIAPGRMWSTDNPEATIQEFGGDPGSPTEDIHIQQVREAMDKISGVPPVAAGIVRDRLGQLSSGNALRITLSALLSKTQAKRVIYGQAIQQLCELTLAWLDASGVLPTAPDDRRIEIDWPEMIDL
jgi:hypothetical protein